MATTVKSVGIEFPDATEQTTAWTGIVTADELDVSNGDGTVGQALVSDGDGSFTWTTIEAGAYLKSGGSWSDVTSSRAINTTYTNSTGETMLVNIKMGYGDFDIHLTIDGGTLKRTVFHSGTHTNPAGFFFVEDGESYKLVAGDGRYFDEWLEYTV